MNEITNKTYVIVTRKLGVFYVDKNQANKIKQLLSLQNPPRGFEIEDSFIETTSIEGVDPVWRYEENRKIKNGEWKCHSKNWHGRFDQCKCGWGMDTSSTKSQLKDKPLTKEQEKRGKIMRKLIQKKYKLKGLSSKTTQELEEILTSL